MQEPADYNAIAAKLDASWISLARNGWNILFNQPPDTVPDRPLPVQTLSPADLAAAPDASLWRLGHSTVLLKLDDRFWLTDPMFAERASPFSWLGPRRFHPPPIALQDVPELAAVILSHDHYDHLDESAIRALAGRAAHFVAPRGVGDLIVEWGVPADKVTQLDWWDQIRIGGVTLVATPASHFSGRGLFDRNRRLWCSWVLKTDDLSLFFGADSGYFDGFREIGERYGPFDVAMIESGAYNTQWAQVHMFPEQTVQANRDVKGRWLLPIHNGTFALAFHGWSEPLERVTQIAQAQGVPVLTPRFGDRVDLRNLQAQPAWWRAVDAPAVSGTADTTPASR